MLARYPWYPAGVRIDGGRTGAAASIRIFWYGDNGRGIGLLSLAFDGLGEPDYPPNCIGLASGLIVLVPVVFIESAIAVRVIGVRFDTAVWLSFWANLLSTVVGVSIGTCLNPLPLTFIRESDTSGFASDLVFPVSLLLPLYLLSVAAEAWVARRFLDESHRQ